MAHHGTSSCRNASETPSLPASKRICTLTGIMWVSVSMLMQVTQSIYTLRLELYGANPSDTLRFAAEIVLGFLICVLFILHFRTIIMVAVSSNRPGGVGWRKGLKAYCTSAAHWADFISNALLLTCIALWWRFWHGYASTFDMELRYPVSNAGRMTASVICT